MLPLDYLHALVLLGIACYVWRREPPRLLITPLTLLSFWVLYGVGNIIYFVGADTLPNVRYAVTVSMILMWLGLIAGIELARATLPALSAQSQRVIRAWERTPLSDDSGTNQLLAATGVLMALFILTVFLALGKPGQVLTFLSLESAREKTKYRVELGGQGGYFYQMLVVAIAPFVSFLLFTKAAASGHRYLFFAGLLLCLVVLIAKLGTFQKIPWVVYLAQLLVVRLVRRRLGFGLGRILVFAFVVVAGAISAALIAVPELEAGKILEWVGYRFFEVNNEVIYQTFYVYPRYLPHTWGMNIGLLHSIFGNGELVSAYVEVANFFGAIGATFDAFFVADAWVDFSYPGVLLEAVLVGFVVKTVDIYVTSLGKTPLAVALLASGMYGLFQLLVTSAFTAFLTGGLLFIPLLVLLSQGLVHDLSRRQVQWQR
jgi:hypothetical protein